MSVLKIFKYPSKALKLKASPVGEVNAEVQSLVDDMVDTMYAAPGVGLAAPQVGVSLRVIVLDTGIEHEDGTVESNLLHFINPEIIKAEDEIEWEEGCLSIPEFTLKMKRASKVRVKALDRDGKDFELSTEGLLAVAIQHEVDHLDGKLLIDNISPLKREMYSKEQKKKHLTDKEPTYL